MIINGDYLFKQNIFIHVPIHDWSNTLSVSTKDKQFQWGVVERESQIAVSLSGSAMGLRLKMQETR